MNLSFFGYLVGRGIAQKRLARAIDHNLVSADQPNRLGFVGGVVKPPVLGIVVASVIAQNEAATLATTTATLSPPVLSAQALDDGNVMLIWSVVQGADSYTVNRTGGGAPVSVHTQINKYEDLKVRPQTKYSYSVQPTKGKAPSPPQNYGPHSRMVTVTTLNDTARAIDAPVHHRRRAG